MYIERKIEPPPHPCKTCITFVMCQVRLQAHVKDSTMNRSHEYDYCDFTGEESNHRDTIMLAFYMELAHCDILQLYIENRMTHLERFQQWKYHIKREVVTVDILYEAFNISLSNILDLNEGLKNGITMP